MTRPVIQALPSGAQDAAILGERLGAAMHEIAVHRFPDDEMRVTVGEAAPTVILYASLDRPNDKLLALLFAAEALRRGGAQRLVLVAPYLCYMRQDTAFHAGEAISQKVIGNLLAQTFDRVVTVDAHLHRLKDLAEALPGIETDNLSAMPAIAEYLADTGFDPASIVAGPDSESEPWVRSLAKSLCADYAIGRKTRGGDRSVEIAFADHAMFANRPVLLVDDIVSSGGTLVTCARALAAAGATAVDAIVTHALFPPQMTQTMLDGGLRSVRSTSSIPHPTNAIRLDGILAGALRKEFTEAYSTGSAP